MCSFDNEADFWSEEEHTARKPYTCEECFAPIPAGARYVRHAMVMDRSCSTLRTHVECMKLWRAVHKKLCGGEGLIMIGGLWEELMQYGVRAPETWSFRMRYAAIQRKYRKTEATL